MRVRRHHHLRLRTAFVAALCLSPLSLAAVYVDNVLRIYADVVDWSYQIPPPDPATLWVANYTRLAEMAEYYDSRFEQFHMPLNFTVDAAFTDGNRTTIKRYLYSDNAGLWTGSSMAGWVFKYVAAKREGNEQMKQDALRVIRNLTHGLAMMVAVPNGGLGPQFGGILARGFAPPWAQDVGYFFFKENPRHHNGTDGTALGGQDFSQWRYRAHTSNDEYGGYYMGVGLVLKFVDDPYCQGLVRTVIDQLATNMLRTNFLGIDAHGGPTGVDQKAKFLSGGGWVLLLLKMAAVAFPEKYERLYYHYAAEELYALMAREGGDQETVSNYYAYHFTFNVVFTLMLLEENSTLSDLYDRYFLNGLRRYTATHRNPYFNLVYLATQSSPGAEEMVERDVEDQLMRFQINHFPDVANGTLPIPEDEYRPITDLDRWSEFFENDPHGSIYRIVVPEVKFDRTFYDKPLSVEYRITGVFMWNDNPFVADWNYVDPTVEFSGSSFTVPYWIGRAFGFFPATGIRTPPEVSS